MPWIMKVRDRHLEVDLAPGVRGREWEDLLDAIVAELSNVDRVLLLVPSGFDAGDQPVLLDGLTRALTARGMDVERRHVG
jgi:hypothetical protein